MIKVYTQFGSGFSESTFLKGRRLCKLFSKMICCYLLVLLPVWASAQTAINGTVKDNKGVPVIGATVTEKGVKNNAVTDINGKFKLTLKGKSGVLTVTYVGYKTQDVTIGTSSELSIVLEEDLNKLNEVVVVGYGTQKKSDLTGSVSSVKSDDLILGGTTSSLGQAIQGKAAGVQVQQSSFAPGGAISITVRGGNSINTSNSPLYVVDGFITDNGNLINPNDIDDIQILKDASATAIYGSRGGNGVILITTKKGKTGKVSIDADVSNGTQYLTYKPDLLTGAQYTAIQNATAIEDGNPPIFPPSFPVTNTNWLKAATQNATVQNRNLSISSGDKNSKIYVSGNYIKQVGVLKNTSMERYSARIGAEKTLNENIKLSANFYGASTNQNQQSYSGDITAPLFSILTAQPNIPVYNPDGTYYVYQGKNNALANLLEPTNTSGNKLVNGNIALDYQIIKGLSYHLGAGSEYNQTTAGQYTPRTLTAGKANNGIAAEQMYTSFRWLVENYFTYKYELKDHAFTLLVGNSNQKDVTESLNAGAKGFPTDAFLFYNLSAGSLTNGYGSNKDQSKLTDYYGRLNYSYKDKLLATFTLRDDASSKFGSNFSHGLFPSGAVAYKFTEDEFIKNLNTFSSLKLRVSYGITGNDRIPNNRYITTFTNYSTVLSDGGPLQVGIEPSILPNPNLKWESTAQFDLGLDMGFANDRINATIDIYRKKTSDLLINIPIGQYWGFSTQLINAGSIQNQGIELSINTSNIRSKDFSWNTSFNISYNKQKTLKLSNNVKEIVTNTANPSGVVSGQPFTKVVPGVELGELYGYVYEGVLKTGETYAPQPNSKPGDPKYKDVNGDGKITPDGDQTYLGNSNPHYTAGFGNDFHYKGFDLNIFIQGAFGYSLFNMNRLVLESTTGADALNRFVAGKNENTDVPREGYFLTTYGGYVNSRFVENASFARLKSVSLGYSFPSSLFQNMKILQGIRIYAEAQNLFTVTSYKGTDPEVNVHAAAVSASTQNVGSINNLAGGLDFGGFPAFRTITFGIKASIH
ncbi:SusC/RagA family TonB-linked outer membrane protein [Mucilaginibacter lappiensis]|uniref:SusC/RagA family TonB-linked outer membrane protein n=1 Tax=Mucilaginibacter lappiensis TaxID=354630 RepID=UPI003D235533